jgi:RNA polymerase sigma-70 factor (ECF subfamily)
MRATLTSKSDRELVLMLQKGDDSAFEELITRHQTKAYNLALRLTKNAEDAEEVLQDVFTSVYRKIDRFEGKSAFSSWMYRIVVNASFMKLRKRNQKPTLSMEELSPTAQQKCLEDSSGTHCKSDSWSINRELRDELQSAINKLPEEYRAVYVLRDVDGLSNQEAAQVLHLTVPAVKSRLHRARIMLKKKLQRYWEEYTEQRFERSISAIAA